MATAVLRTATLGLPPRKLTAEMAAPSIDTIPIAALRAVPTVTSSNTKPVMATSLALPNWEASRVRPKPKRKHARAVMSDRWWLGLLGLVGRGLDASGCRCPRSGQCVPGKTTSPVQ